MTIPAHIAAHLEEARKAQTDRLLAAFKNLRYDIDREALVEQAENWALDQKK